MSTKGSDNRAGLPADPPLSPACQRALEVEDAVRRQAAAVDLELVSLRRTWRTRRGPRSVLIWRFRTLSLGGGTRLEYATSTGRWHLGGGHAGVERDPLKVVGIILKYTRMGEWAAVYGLGAGNALGLALRENLARLAPVVKSARRSLEAGDPDPALLARALSAADALADALRPLSPAAEPRPLTRMPQE
jgi:hypothetical protein